MSLKTPSRETYEKKVHTPPSVERDPEYSKFLKTVPRKAFRRSSNADNVTLESDGLFVPAPGLSSRGIVPHPLNIPQFLSPPPSVKKKPQGSPILRAAFQHVPTNSAIDQLESPIHLTPSVKVQSLERPFGTFTLSKAGNRSVPRSQHSPHDDTIIWTDSVDDPYLEEDSPTYLRSISRNITNVNAKSGHRRFIGTKCAMCDEKICNVLSGEKIVELTCSHASHFQCYFATLECLYLEKKYPCCGVCGKTVKPSDEGTLEMMTSRLLSRKSVNTDPGSVIGPQWLDLKLLHSAESTSLLTPSEQVIRTADVSSSGFRTPYQSLKSATFPGFGQALSQRNGYLGNSSTTANRKTSKISPSVCGGTSEPQIYLKSCAGCSAYEVTVKIPLDEEETSLQSKEDGFEDERQSLRKQVEVFVKGQVDIGGELGSLMMFDMVAYSTDGEQWDESVMIYLFDEFLLLFNHDEMAARGKIPLKQVCQVLRLNDKTLLIDLKSRALPEVYISFPSDESNNPLLLKWKFYLAQRNTIPDLDSITTTAWDTLPEELLQELELFRIKVSRSQGTSRGAGRKSWQALPEDIPLQLIVCLNLSQVVESKMADHETYLGSGLSALLSCLNEQDLLGIVAVGKDGRGNVGNYGTFIGTINKLWPHWEETFESLQAINCRIFGTPANELDKMLETCLRLVSTAKSMLEEGSSSHFLKQVILLRDGEPPSNDHKYGRLISDVHDFDLMQMAALVGDGEIEELKRIVSLLHRRSTRDLTVKLANQEIFFGNLGPGEERTLCYKLTGPIHSCDISWFDMRSQQLETITRPVHQT